MPGFNDTLNNIIAVVVVILILSLVVQAVQSVAKKLTKIKSRQIEESLVDLFTNMLNKPGFRPATRIDKLIDHSPMWRIVFFWRPSAAQQADVEDIFNRVIEGFKDVGRLAQSGERMLDSIAKGDLLKILQKVPVNCVLPGFVDSVGSAFGEIANLQKRILDLKKAAEQGPANETFRSIVVSYRSLELLFAPVFADVRSIFLTDGVAVPRPADDVEINCKNGAGNLLVRDVMILSKIDTKRVEELLDEMQKTISHAIDSAADDSLEKKGLTDLMTGLNDITQTIDSLRYRLGPAVGAFQTKTREASEWYDIVMQSFEERYTRSMKSWAVLIAFLVVAGLNANFFNIYRNITTSAVTRNLLVDKGSDVLKLSQDRETPDRTDESAAQPAPAQPSAQSAAAPAQPGVQQGRKQPTANGSQGSLEERGRLDRARARIQRDNQAREDLNSAIKLIKSDTELYKGIGFSPLRWQQVKDFFSSLIPDKNTEQPWGYWWAARKHDVMALIGWIIMTILLSIGAPFWQDTLESLFGVKNLLRKRGEIQNVEQRSGEGQTKP
jgi:hypothetical protein